VSQALAPRNVAERRDRIHQIADDLIDNLPDEGAIDLVDDFAAPFSFAVLSDMIGLPIDLQRRFRREWCGVVQPVGPRSPRRATYIGLLSELQEFIGDVILVKREYPADDLLSDLVNAADEGHLSDEELTSTVFQLLVAGQEPVTNMICMAVITLLRNPEQLEKLRSGVVEMSTAVAELLRYDGSFELTTWRFFAEPTELYGVQVPAGDSVIIALSAANRDPNQFDEPDQLDLSRTPNPHLGFGHGIHYCPGAALGRAELEIGLETLIRRLPDLKFETPPDLLGWVPAVLTRGVVRLPVTFDAAAAPARCPLHTT
jgi:cytochrome P450